MPEGWTLEHFERGYLVRNGNRMLMLHLPPSLTPIQVRDCAWNHFTTICGGGIR